MRPILMKGHERPLTFLKYNREGDLLFSCAKDNTPTVWFADTGERLGTYRGHNGAVWCCDVSRELSSLLLSRWIPFYFFSLSSSSNFFTIVASVLYEITKLAFAFLFALSCNSLISGGGFGDLGPCFCPFCSTLHYAKIEVSSRFRYTVHLVDVYVSYCSLSAHLVIFICVR